MKVLKFGGSSVGSPERIRGVRKIIDSQSLPCVVVVSAFQGVTDELSLIASVASGGISGYRDHLEKLIIKHNDFARNLIIDKARQKKTLEEITVITNELRELLNGIFLLHECTKHSLDQVLSYGERLS